MVLLDLPEKEASSNGINSKISFITCLAVFMRFFKNRKQSSFDFVNVWMAE